jgi:hypothetical protein
LWYGQAIFNQSFDMKFNGFTIFMLSFLNGIAGSNAAR